MHAGAAFLYIYSIPLLHLSTGLGPREKTSGSVLNVCLALRTMGLNHTSHDVDAIADACFSWHHNLNREVRLQKRAVLVRTLSVLRHCAAAAGYNWERGMRGHPGSEERGV
jgi:hypothetical protein